MDTLESVPALHPSWLMKVVVESPPNWVSVQPVAAPPTGVPN